MRLFKAYKGYGRREKSLWHPKPIGKTTRLPAKNCQIGDQSDGGLQQVSCAEELAGEFPDLECVCYCLKTARAKYYFTFFVEVAPRPYPSTSFIIGVGHLAVGSHLKIASSFKIVVTPSPVSGPRSAFQQIELLLSLRQ